MKPSFFAISASAAGLAVAAASPVFAQSTSSGTGWTMPYERGFWGHAGISAGRSDLDVSCTAGLPCDTKDEFYRAFAGGRFNNAVGMEVGLMHLGKFNVNGLDADGWGLDLALVAGIPIGANSSVFGKIGAAYTDTDVDVAGSEDGFGARVGIGAQIGLTQNWALRGDIDRYRVRFPGGKEDVDTATIGLQYTFR